MEITRQVILDLLPLYLANEASADTRALVEEYLETDPELARMATQSAATDLSAGIPIPLTKEDQMEAYKHARQLLRRRTAVLAVVISFAVLAVLGILGMALLAAGFFVSV